MSDLTRVKGIAGRRRRIALLAGHAHCEQPNPIRVRLFRPPDEQLKSAVLTDARTTPAPPRPGDEQGKSGNDCTEPDDALLEVTLRVALCSTYFPLRAVVVVVTAGRALLLGRIPSFYLKQVAQETVRRVPGVAGFENRLVVET